jgi:hypothetical protein
MVSTLPKPEIVRCYFDDGCDLPLPAMCLSWPSKDGGSTEEIWELPEGIRLIGPAPERFGVSIRRQNADAYAVQLLWDRTYLQWPTLSRRQLLTGSLATLLEAIGTDLWYLLDQPIEATNSEPLRAA